MTHPSLPHPAPIAGLPGRGQSALLLMLLTLFLSLVLGGGTGLRSPSLTAPPTPTDAATTASRSAPLTPPLGPVANAQGDALSTLPTARRAETAPHWMLPAEGRPAPAGTLPRAARAPPHPAVVSPHLQLLTHTLQLDGN